MSESEDKSTKDTSKQLQPNANKRVGWGPVAAVFYGFFASQAPVVLIGAIISFVAVRQNKSIDNLLENLTALQNVGINLFVAAMATTLIYLYVDKRGGLKALGFDRFKKRYIKEALGGFVGYLLIFQIVFIAISLLLPGFDSEQVQRTVIDGEEGVRTFAVGFIGLVIIPPLYEEILYRGFAFQGLANTFGFLPAAFVTSALFGLAHGQWNVAIDTFILGMIAAWLVWKTKSIWPAILLHGAKNLLAFALRFLFV